ncbi:hypothetical protein MYX78_03695 [Acidobacteria bacterium AH-259-G07]|nr:hypothetical protein [Acidobacteria bacterium AH-259-G07]
MTLIVAIPCEDGIVFGSDSQLTTGLVRTTGTKIFTLNTCTLWGGSGELAVIQRVTEQLENYPDRDQPLGAVRDNLVLFVKNAIEAMLRTDFRVQFFASDPEKLLQLHPADFLFVEYREHNARMLHVLTNGTSEWVEGHCAVTGSGNLFAYALLQKYSSVRLNRDGAKVLVYKVIEEAIQVGAYGLGLPIDIWEVSATGACQATQEEIAAMQDTARMLGNREVDLLMDHTQPSADQASAEGTAPPQLLADAPDSGSE